MSNTRIPYARDAYRNFQDGGLHEGGRVSAPGPKLTLMARFLRSQDNEERIALSRQMEDCGEIKVSRFPLIRATSPLSATKICAHPSRVPNPNRWK